MFTLYLLPFNQKTVMPISGLYWQILMCGVNLLYTQELNKFTDNNYLRLETDQERGHWWARVTREA